MEFGKPYFLILVLALACSPKGAEKASVPKPGLDHLLQIYMLADAAEAGPWFPASDSEGFSSTLVRIERVSVASDAEAERTLRDWNARPIDVLILGPGLPLASWRKLRMPRSAKRLTLALSDEAVEGATSVHPDRMRLRNFLRGVCSQRIGLNHFGCESDSKLEVSLLDALPKPPVKTQRLLVRFGSPRNNPLPAALEVRFRWPELLNALIQKNSKQELGAEFLVDPFSGFLDLKLGAQLPKPAAEQLERLRQDWLLSELANGSHASGSK